MVSSFETSIKFLKTSELSWPDWDMGQLRACEKLIGFLAKLKSKKWQAFKLEIFEQLLNRDSFQLDLKFVSIATCFFVSLLWKL